MGIHLSSGLWQIKPLELPIALREVVKGIAARLTFFARKKVSTAYSAS
jgi:hypothetical protein